MTDTILANARLVLPQEVMLGALVFRAGRIAEILPGSMVPKGAIDCGGDLLAPGLIELHTDNLERHMEPRPKVKWPHGPAIIAHDAELAGVGITTVFDALRAKGALRINHLLHLRAEVCSETLLDELAAFGPDDSVGIVSLMDHTPGQRQFRDLSKLKDYVCGKHGLSDAGFDDHVAQLVALHARLGAAHEAAAVAAAARFGAVLASHDDTTAPQVATSAGYGIRLAEFPTTVEAASACRDHGIAVMMGAPNLMRGGSHSGNVAAKDLAEAGLLDIVSSDYVPGALLSAALMLGDLYGSVARGFASVTSAPAHACGLNDRGEIGLGLRADLVRVQKIDEAAIVRGLWVGGARVA